MKVRDFLKSHQDEQNISVIVTDGTDEVIYWGQDGMEQLADDFGERDITEVIPDEYFEEYTIQVTGGVATTKGDKHESQV